MSPELLNLSHTQIERMAEQVAGGKGLPGEVLQQIVEKTDGVPLFVEEMTKAVLESEVLKEVNGQYELVGMLSSLAIPSTLQDSLMARMDRLVTAKAVAQYAAVIGRQFSYTLLSAVSQVADATLQRELGRLAEAELVYQRGLPPQATYTFKHALIQDSAYQSLLQSTRQQYHQRIAQVIETQFAEIVDAQPELLAHHYTEAGLLDQAINYWQQAGHKAVQRSANMEAISHFSNGMKLITTLPETPERDQQEFVLQTALGPVLMAAKGWASPEVEQTYARARELCGEAEETPQLFAVVWGLWRFYLLRDDSRTAPEPGNQLLNLARHLDDLDLLIEAHRAVGQTQYYMGDFCAACKTCQQGIDLYSDPQHRSLGFRYGTDPKAQSLSVMSWALTLVQSQGVCYDEANMWRLKGTLILGQPLDNQSDAESCFNQALTIARQQQAKSWELRAATSLARLWQQQGKRQDAYDLLAPVYEWFTEGFDTADLQEAKGLLGELPE
jgi:predicted ATPase